jgi:sigma-B regulation protein RsbU (phosphoserine phosphatase)
LPGLEVQALIHLGTLSLNNDARIAEARTKILHICTDLADDRVTATRLATAASQMCRSLIQESTRPSIAIDLYAEMEGPIFVLTFLAEDSLPTANMLNNFFDSAYSMSAGDGRIGIRAIKLIRGQTLPTAEKIEQFRNLVAVKSRDELMGELQIKNRELQKSFEDLKRTTMAKERMEGELSVGRSIQMSMVPLDFPAFPDRGEFDLHALLKPAREVGGDFYDYFLISQDELYVVIGDVSGKGVPAALFMAVTRTMMKTRAADDNAPASIMTAVNDELSADNSESMFVTLFLGIFNIRTGQLNFTNAGHNFPYIKRASGEIETISQLHGPVAGAMEGLIYKQDCLFLQPGDLLLMFTDGVSEAMDVGLNLYSEQRIIDFLSKMEGSEPIDTVNGLADSVDDYADEEPQFDDITILALRCNQAMDSADTEQLNLKISNDLSEIGKAVEAFEAFSEKTELPMAIAMKVNLVFDELLNNIVSYAFMDGGEHQIDIHIETSVDRLLIQIEDDGLPFNPFAHAEVDTTLSLEEREIGGLGTHLVLNVMDDVSYERHSDRNVVTLIKKLED